MPLGKRLIINAAYLQRIRLSESAQRKCKKERYKGERAFHRSIIASQDGELTV